MSRHWLPALPVSFLLCLLPATSIAANQGAHWPSEVIFLAQIIALIVCGRLMGELMQRIGQPAVMGQLIAGILLGPSVLGALWPGFQHFLFPASPEQKAMIDAVAQLGILLLLLLTGMETDLSVVRRSRRAAFSVSITGIAIPFLCGVLLGELLPDKILPNPGERLITALFLGTALSISSVKIVAMVVREVGFLRRTVGQVIVASAIIDDTRFLASSSAISGTERSAISTSSPSSHINFVRERGRALIIDHLLDPIPSRSVSWQTKTASGIRELIKQAFYGTQPAPDCPNLCFSLPQLRSGHIRSDRSHCCTARASNIYPELHCNQPEILMTITISNLTVANNAPGTGIGVLTTYDASGNVISRTYTLTKGSAGFFAISGSQVVTAWSAPIPPGHYSVRVHITVSTSRVPVGSGRTA